MKNLFFLSLLLSLLHSCDSNDKYNGKWILNHNASNYDAPKQFQIENDSIKFNFTYFNFYHRYQLIRTKDGIQFNNFKVKGIINKDTLEINNLNRYVRGYQDSILKDYELRDKVKINLPKIRNFQPTSQIDNDYIINLYFGTKKGSNDYSLLLNDRYGKIEDLPLFLYVGCGGSRREELTPFQSTFLFADKNSKMKDIEEIFLTMSLSNKTKISFINNIKLNVIDSIGFKYEYDRTLKKLPAFLVNEKYFTKNYDFPLPPPYSFNFFKKNNKDKINYIFLKKNKYIYQNREIDSNRLLELIEKIVESNEIVFSLFDLESNYSCFLEMINIIDFVYLKKRKQLSILQFNKSFESLSREETLSIKYKSPIKHIWSYSIPHYNSILKDNKDFFGLNTKPLDSLLSNSFRNQ